MEGQNCTATKDCQGIIEGGFCNVCGMEPAVAAPPPATAGGGGSHNVSSSQQRTGTGSTALSGRTETTGSRRGSVGSRVSSSRKQLGLGIFTVPEMLFIDPALAVMKDPRVPDKKRICNGSKRDGSACESPLAREKGFCGVCGAKYNFVPALKQGDLVADQYEVAGPIAFGGMGWIYLAKDVTLGRWVVLKGLLNSSDPALAAAAVAERQFLAEVKHANIVGIYTFVQHNGAGYIVMEYVGGKTLKSMRQERGPLPVAEVLVYMHRTLGAFAYMHRGQLVYCDFKPDNVMLEGDDIKVIDLGGVRRLNDTTGDIYSTVGYSAPEVAKSGPSVVSDLYTIGRTIAVLVTDFKGYQSKFQYSLLTPEQEPVYAKYESLYRFLLKATHQNPNMRFQSADEMSEQLLGVLREVAAQELQSPRPGVSSLYNGDTLGLLDVQSRGVDTLDIDSVPSLKRDASDPATQFILTNMSSDPNKQTVFFQSVMAQYPDSVEALLGMAKNQIRVGKYAEAENFLAQVEKKDAFDWRVVWYRGLSFLAQGHLVDAREAFDTCYSELPGELAPKLAIAVTSEKMGDLNRANLLYDTISRTDPSYATAVFGLARCLAQAGKRNEAVEALSRITQTSSLYGDAQKTSARILIKTSPNLPGASELARAGKAIEALALQGLERFRLVEEVLSTALSLIGSRQLDPAPDVQLLGQSLEDHSIRLGLEQAYRSMAHLATNPADKIGLVDAANKVRPRTIL